ncbi:MAG: UDP-N-acetylglucosamine 1-carboxyvinyltransferase, partial [Oligoflexales bacterium]|nr:UDP-N-acetylglucosamine 1-carboxyvinyltransferase [Oligoflexales bacterium]
MAQFIVEGGRPLNGTVTVSGNKNEALPAVMACLLTDEEIVLKRMPKIGDILTLCNILEDIGVSVNWLDEETLCLQAKEIKTHRPNPALCAKARASILFLGPLLARLGKIELAPPGGDVIGARRMDSHFQGIRDLGAKLEFGPPISGTQKRPIGADIFLDEPSVTASENILLNAVLADGLTTLHNAASEPHVQGLCNLLNAMGAKISGIGTNRLLIQGVAKLHGAKHRIGQDFMEIGSFLCLGAIAKGKIEIKDIDIE